MSKLDPMAEKYHIPTYLAEMINAEIGHAIEKHGHGKDATPDAFARILGEEFGECCKAINKKDYVSLTKETIQVIAVCIMFERGILKDSTE
jgi:NTP pyrophosphatase (non-canonical NTP hydrolase)